MKRFRADLHIHTVLSACADLGMSPGAIVNAANDRQLDLIGITDHNSTLQCEVVRELAEENNLVVLMGAEITTREEVHCLAFFQDRESLGDFQEYLDRHLPVIPYKPEKFGYQVLVDRSEKILRQLGNYLNIGISQSIDQVEQEVHRLGGLFVPAHIERTMFGIFNQLGFIPDSLSCDALGIMSTSDEADIRKKFGISSDMSLVKASDAHVVEQIGTGLTIFEMNAPTFDEIGKALKGKEGRKIIVA